MKFPQDRYYVDKYGGFLKSLYTIIIHINGKYAQVQAKKKKYQLLKITFLHYFDWAVVY